MAEVEKIHGYIVHPAASYFPLLGKREIAKLAQDIKENGLKQPIIKTPDGKLLDGRNRLNAWVEAGLKVKDIPFTVYELPDEVDTANEKAVDRELFHTVWSLNYQRRHLSDRQKNAIALKMHDAIGDLADVTPESLAEETKTKKSTARKVMADRKKNKGKIDDLAEGKKGKQGRPAGGAPPRRVTLDREDMSPAQAAETVVEKWANAPRSYLKNFLFQLDKKFTEYEAEQELLTTEANGAGEAAEA